MVTYPLPTLAARVDATGISAPPFTDVLESLKAIYRSIYGSDVYLQPDSQDGQFLGALASVIDDCNSMAASVYNAFSPATAQGTGLSRVVKINGIQRAGETHSTADLTIDGQAGTEILNGQAGDITGQKWTLPTFVTIPVSGEVVVTATCTVAGAKVAAAGAITKILTPTLGWQSVTNVAAAKPGAPVESDAALRVRQAQSTDRPALTPFEATVAEVANVAGVTRLAPYENDTDATDANGIPRKAICLVVDGGDALAVAQAIAAKKTPGCYTHGTTSRLVPDKYGIPHTIRYFRPTIVRIKVAVAITALPGYTSAVGDQIKAANAAFISALAIGDDVLRPRLYVPTQLGGAPASATFEVTSIQIARGSGALGSADIVLAFNEAAICDIADVTLTVT